MTTPADQACRPVGNQSVGEAILAGINPSTKSTVLTAVGATGTTMPGERRLYKTRKGKAVAHGLWPCCHPPGASADRWQPGRDKPVNPETKPMMYTAGLCLLLAAAGLRTRIGRLWLAVRLFRASNALDGAASRILDQIEREAGL